MSEEGRTMTVFSVRGRLALPFLFKEPAQGKNLAMRVRALVKMDLGRVGLTSSIPFCPHPKICKSLVQSRSLFKEEADLFQGRDLLEEVFLRAGEGEKTRRRRPAGKDQGCASSIASETVRYLRERVE